MNHATTRLGGDAVQSRLRDLDAKIERETQHRDDLGAKIQALEVKNQKLRERLKEQRDALKRESDGTASPSDDDASSAPPTRSSLALDVCASLADANAVMRARLAQLFVQKSRLALQYSEISKEDRIRLEEQLATKYFDFPIHKGEETPFSLSKTDPMELAKLWQEFAGSLGNKQQATASAFAPTTNGVHPPQNSSGSSSNHTAAAGAAENPHSHNGEGAATNAPDTSRFKGTFASDCSHIVRTLEQNQKTYEEVTSKPTKSGESVDIDNNYGFTSPNPEFPDMPDFVYIFDDPDVDTNIKFSDRTNGNQNPDLHVAGNPTSSSSRTVDAAKLHKLVERLTHEDHNDLNTRFVFLLTHISFTTSLEVIQLLKQRYYVPTPPNLTGKEIKIFQNKRGKIRIKVFSILKYWLEEHWEDDFTNSAQLVSELKRFMRSILKDTGGKWTKQAKRIVEMIQSEESRRPRTTEVVRDTPKPIVKQGVNADNLDSFDLEEVARQMSLRDFETFKDIKPRECLNTSWTGPKKAERAPNITAMIGRFNAVATWVQHTILSQGTIQQRAKTFAKFVKLAEQCEAINNFHSMVAISTGLRAIPINRLVKMRQKSGVIPRFEKIANLCSVNQNYKVLRERVQTALTPCIPHVGTFLKDLTNIEEIPNSKLGMINFQKRRQLAERILWIKQYQQESYPFEEVEDIRRYLGKHCAKVLYTETELFAMSKAYDSTDK